MRLTKYWFLSALTLIMLAACAAEQPQLARTGDEADLHNQVDQEAAAKIQLARNEWATQLIAVIARNWAWPPGADPAWRAWAKFKIDPTGTVQSVEIARSSGNEIFDASLITAINKASPLPLPRDPRAFDPRIEACFSPKWQNCQ